MSIARGSFPEVNEKLNYKQIFLIISLFVLQEGGRREGGGRE